METIDLPAWLGTLLIGVLLLVVVAWARIIRRASHSKPIIARRLRRRVPWGLDGALLAGLYLFAAVMSSAVGSTASDPADAENALVAIGFRQVGIQTLTLLVFTSVALGLLVANHSLSRLRWSDFGFTTTAKRFPRDVTFGVLGAAAMLPMVYAANAALIMLLGEPTPHPAVKQLMSEPTLQSIAAVALLAVVVAPLCEEMAFRVLLQGGLERDTSRRAWWPILVSSVCFGIAHTNQGFAQTPIIILAIGLGYVYRQTHSYVAVVSMHMAFNALSLAVALGAGQALAAQ